MVALSQRERDTERNTERERERMRWGICYSALAIFSHDAGRRKLEGAGQGEAGLHWMHVNDLIALAKHLIPNLFYANEPRVQAAIANCQVASGNWQLATGNSRHVATVGDKTVLHWGRQAGVRFDVAATWQFYGI